MFADLVDVLQVLQRDGRHWNIKDIEILLADQVQQQVQRAFKCLEKDFQRIGRDVQIVGHAKQRLAIQPRKRDAIDDARRRIGLSGQGQFRCTRRQLREQFAHGR